MASIQIHITYSTTCKIHKSTVTHRTVFNIIDNAEQRLVTLCTSLVLIDMSAHTTRLNFYETKPDGVGQVKQGK